MLLVAVVWAVYLSECFVRWRPGDWIFRRGANGAVHGVNRPDVTFWNDRFAFAWTSAWPGDPALRFCGEHLDTPACQTRLDDLRRRSRWLRVSATVLFLTLLVAFPSLVLAERLLPWLPWLLGTVLLAWGGTLVAFLRTYRSVHEGRPPAEVWLTHALSPVSLIGAPAVVALDVAAQTHPVVAADLLCRDDEFLRIARLWHFDSPELRPDIERRAERRGLGGRLGGPPAEVEGGLSRYCPRCHGTFREAASVCADCPGVDLALLKMEQPHLESSFRNDDPWLPGAPRGLRDLRDRTRRHRNHRSRRRAGHPRGDHRRQAS